MDDNRIHETHWLDDPRHVKLLWRGFLVVLALTVLVEPFVELHPHFGIEGWFAFHAWYGLLVCIVMIALREGARRHPQAPRHVLRRRRWRRRAWPRAR